MMASQQSKPHDPMYTFDTHFPERLSRLHLHSETPGSFRKKKSRTQRNLARYKTQPVTFDEIKEVDEEPVAEEKLTPDNLMGQLQAFSRSMDGLLPRNVHEHGHFHFTGSHSRSGSRKFQRHPDCIPEKVETEPQQQQQQQQKPQPLQPNSQGQSQNPEAATKPPERLPSLHQAGVKGDNSSISESATGPLPASQSTLSPEVGADGLLPPVSPTNMASRRQKVTAKAKKRQKASEEGQ